MVPDNPSPLAGEGGSRAAAEGRGGGNFVPDHQLHARHKLMSERTKAMRREQTEAEKRLWFLLRAKRLGRSKWRNQVNFEDRYIADFVCFEHRLIVEADGGQHSENRYDEQRDRWVQSQGFRIFRFWNNDILSNTEGVATSIMAAMNANPSPQTPLPQEERGFRR